MSPKERQTVYLEYLQMKVQERDWKAAQVALADLIELESAHPHLKPNPLMAKVTL